MKAKCKNDVGVAAALPRASKLQSTTTMA